MSKLRTKNFSSVMNCMLYFKWFATVSWKVPVLQMPSRKLDSRIDRILEKRGWMLAREEGAQL
jgi:hypothetical protein